MPHQTERPDDAPHHHARRQQRTSHTAKADTQNDKNEDEREREQKPQIGFDPFIDRLRNRMVTNDVNALGSFVSRDDLVDAGSYCGAARDT